MVPDQVMSTNKNQEVKSTAVQGQGGKMLSGPSLSAVVTTTAPTMKTDNEVVNATAATNGVSQATITAAAIAAATNAPTAADFTAVAQAAVSTLIMNAGTQSASSGTTPSVQQHQLTKSSSVSSISDKGLTKCGSSADVSTAHVTALTSSNW